MKKALAAVALVMLMAAPSQASPVVIGAYVGSSNSLAGSPAVSQGSWNVVVTDYTEDGKDLYDSTGVNAAYYSKQTDDSVSITGLTWWNDGKIDVLVSVTGEGLSYAKTYQGVEDIAYLSWTGFTSSRSIPGGYQYLLSNLQLGSYEGIPTWNGGSRGDFEGIALLPGVGASLTAFQIAPGGTYAALPEPATLSLLVLGGVATLIRRRNRR